MSEIYDFTTFYFFLLPPAPLAPKDMRVRPAQKNSAEGRLKPPPRGSAEWRKEKEVELGLRDILIEEDIGLR